MLKPSHYSIVLAIVIIAGGCDSVSEATAAPVKSEIQGELNEASYKQAAAKALAEARQAMVDGALTEARLDAIATKIEGLMTLDKLDVDKARLGEAEFMSTLGALYVRKAQFHTDNASQAGEYLSKGFRYLDRAVARYPEDITVRISRGIAAAKLPPFLNKAGIARDDLRFVLGRPEFAKLPAGLQAKLRATLDEVERQLAREAT